MILSAKDKLSLFLPSERSVLWIISSHPEAFTISFLLEVGNELARTEPKPDSNLTKAMAIASSLEQRKFIKIGAERTVITFKGQLYRLFTHPGVSFWGIIIGALVGIAAIFYAGQPTKETHPTITNKKQPPIADSLLYHQKSKSNSSRKK